MTNTETEPLWEESDTAHSQFCVNRVCFPTSTVECTQVSHRGYTWQKQGVCRRKKQELRSEENWRTSEGSMMEGRNTILKTKQKTMVIIGNCKSLLWDWNSQATRNDTWCWRCLASKEQPQALRIPLLYANRVKNKLQGRNSCRMDKSTEHVTPPVIKKAKRKREAEKQKEAIPEPALE